jgi:20S proteasome alpha/beta subunit
VAQSIALSTKRYTQSGGVRPFGISTLIVGFDPNETDPRLYQTEPSGIYSAWKVCHPFSAPVMFICLRHHQANAIGRSSKTVREFLEKNHKDDMTRDESIKLTVKSLLEVVQTGAKNIEISVMESYGKVTVRGCAVCPFSPRLRVILEFGPCTNRSHRTRNRTGEGSW